MGVKQYLPVAVLSSWAGMLAYLLANGNYQLFLKPGFQWLIITGLVIGLTLCLGMVFTGISSMPVQKNAWIKGLILILPLGFIIAAGENTLGEYALSKRTMVSQAPASLSPESNPKENTDAVPLSLDEPILISDLIRQFSQYDGKKVRIEGMYADTVAGRDELSAVFRYFITCCAADAQPVGVFISRNPDSGFENNDWVRVSGTVRMTQLDGYEVIFMDLENMEAVEKPGKNAAYIFN